MTRREVTLSGLTFRSDGPWRYGVHRRYAGNAAVPSCKWNGFGTFTMPDTARHVFARAVKLYDGGEVFLIDYDAGRIMAKGRYGRILFDHMTPTKG